MKLLVLLCQYLNNLLFSCGGQHIFLGQPELNQYEDKQEVILCWESENIMKLSCTKLHLVVTINNLNYANSGPFKIKNIFECFCYMFSSELISSYFIIVWFEGDHVKNKYLSPISFIFLTQLVYVG